MKISIFFAFSGLLFIIIAWSLGVSFFNLVILLIILLINGGFQVWARGDVNWNEKINIDEIKKKMPVWVYSFTSSGGFLLVILYISKITKNI